MLKIDISIVNRLATQIAIFIIISLSTYTNDVAQTDQKPIKMSTTSITNSIYDLIDFGESQIWSNSGIASYYGNKFHLRKTSSGDRYDKNDHTAAHKKLPFGTILRVTNQNNLKSTLVRVNDRGPFIKNRIIDLSLSAAQDISGLGLPKVTISGFVPNKIKINNPENYYLVYSINDDPAIYNKDIFEIIGDYQEFQNVLEDYQYLIKVNQSFENNLFILLSADEYNINPNKINYKLGYFKNFEPKRIPFNIAERNKK